MRYRIETRLRPGEVFARAQEYFGSSGKLGLELTQRGVNHRVFTGGGGYVTLSARPVFNHTRVDLEVWQFDTEARGFTDSLPGPAGPLRALVDGLRRRPAR
ncbi:MAG TPA: hypothetical protein VMU89_01655 [Thermomicrobiaceae bacterium]|nr:hypothetical protein [Thermomicrobiaceae bacterium]